jgi:O-antigen ligase
VSFLKYQDRIASINSFLTILMLFVLPFSYAFSNFLMGIILLLWLYEGDLKRKFIYAINNKIVLAIIGYVAFIWLGMLWTEDMDAAKYQFSKTLKLLLVIVFITVVKKEHLYYYIIAFLSSIIIAMLASYGVIFEILPPFGRVSWDGSPVPFMGYGVYAPLLAFAIYILLDRLLNSSDSVKSKLFYSVLVIAMTTNLFITGGKGGQLVFILLLFVTFIRYFRDSLFKAIMFPMVVSSLLFYLAFTQSSYFNGRVMQLVNSFDHLTNPQELAKDGSSGIRLIWYLNSLEVIKMHPLFGVGTGDVEREAQKTISQFDPNARATRNPHSMWLMVAMQIGLVGLIVVWSMFWFMYRYSRQQNDRLTNIRYGFITLFFVINFYGSYLQAGQSKTIFLVFLALLFYGSSEFQRSQKTKEVDD